jgi:hypothetical protein
MAKLVYRIVKHENGWAYKVRGTFSETFASHDEALAAAWILAKQGRFLVTAAFIAAFAAILYFLLWLELLDELGIARAPWA